MRVCVILMAIALMVVGAVGVMAVPTLEGPTGVVTLPTAEVVPQGMLELALDRHEDAGEYTITPLRINWGVAKNLELHATYAPWDSPWGSDGDSVVCIGGLKYQLPMSFANVAIGGSFGQEKFKHGDNIDMTKAYLAVSKDFGLTSSVNARLTGGAVYNKFKEGSWNYDFTRPYVALELMHQRGVTVAVEYRWKDNDWDNDTPISTVLRYTSPDKPVWVEVGTTNMSYMSEAYGPQKGFIGIGTSFGN